jgi:hypothetical protein
VNRLNCPQATSKLPSANKYEMFFLAKYLLKARLCTIEIKVSHTWVHRSKFKLEGRQAIDFYKADF